MVLGEKRSFRLRSRSTTIKLEHPFWQVLEGIAGEQKISLARLVTRIDEVSRSSEKQGGEKQAGDKKSDKRNLASSLRVYCLMSAAAETAGQPGKQREMLGYG